MEFVRAARSDQATVRGAEWQARTQFVCLEVCLVMIIILLLLLDVVVATVKAADGALSGKREHSVCALRCVL